MIPSHSLLRLAFILFLSSIANGVTVPNENDESPDHQSNPTNTLNAVSSTVTTGDVDTDVQALTTFKRRRPVDGPDSDSDSNPFVTATSAVSQGRIRRPAAFAGGSGEGVPIVNHTAPPAAEEDLSSTSPLAAFDAGSTNTASNNFPTEYSALYSSRTSQYTQSTREVTSVPSVNPFGTISTNLPTEATTAESSFSSETSIYTYNEEDSGSNRGQDPSNVNAQDPSEVNAYQASTGSPNQYLPSSESTLSTQPTQYSYTYSTPSSTTSEYTTNVVNPNVPAVNYIQSTSNVNAYQYLSDNPAQPPTNTQPPPTYYSPTYPTNSYNTPPKPQKTITRMHYTTLTTTLPDGSSTIMSFDSTQGQEGYTSAFATVDGNTLYQVVKGSSGSSSSYKGCKVPQATGGNANGARTGQWLKVVPMHGQRTNKRARLSH